MTPGPAPGFRVELVDFNQAREALRAVRDVVFIHEQQVPPELEHDPADPQHVHALARDAQGQPIGTGRISPSGRIGRMAVLAEWRGHGVGNALLRALLVHARARAMPEASLHAQASAIDFYARHGFIACGERFQEAGIEHQAMRRMLAGPMAVEDRDEAVIAATGVISRARSRLWIHSRELDPGLLDAASVLTALRRFAVDGRGRQVSILLHDPAAAQRAHAPLLALAQRLPSVFQFRAVDDPVDRAYAAAFIASDSGAYYFRSLGHRYDGDWDVADAGRARQLAESFKPVWERSRPCSELRALGL
ncbi:GNAT family N-acetyltransferase [Luteimonas sp. A277]